MKNILETITQVSILEHHSTNVGLSQFVMVLRVNNEWCEKSCQWSVEEVWCVCVCVCCVCVMFLTLPSQGTTPHILKLEFPMQTWGPKQKS